VPFVISNSGKTEYSTNGSTGQREKAPAEPVCLITLNQSKSNRKTGFGAAEVGWSGDIGAKWRSRNKELWRFVAAVAGMGEINRVL